MNLTLILILGIIIGLAIASLVFSILAFFRSGIEKQVKIIETKLSNAGPRQRGAIFMPKDEAEEAREKIVEENRREGKDTPIEDLQ